MKVLPLKDVEVSLDGSGNRTVKLVEGKDINLPDDLAKWLVDCKAVEEVVAKKEATVEEVVNAFTKKADLVNYATEKEITLESVKLADMKVELLEKVK